MIKRSFLVGTTTHATGAWARAAAALGVVWLTATLKVNNIRSKAGSNRIGHADASHRDSLRNLSTIQIRASVDASIVF